MNEQDENGRYDADAVRDDLGIAEDDRLPWLETAEEYDDDRTASPLRIAGLVLGGLLVLAAVIGGIWWLQQRGAPGGQDGRGDLIAAQEGDYKVKPTDPEGKTFEGEGDTAFAASQGKSSEGTIMVPTARDVPPPDAKAAANAKAAAGAKPALPEAAVPAGAGLVQLGSFSDTAKADAEWKRLGGRFAQLSGLQRKITTGSVEGRTVYRLSAVTANPAAAATLCAGLKAAGGTCLVVR